MTDERHPLDVHMPVADMEVLAEVSGLPQRQVRAIVWFAEKHLLEALQYVADAPSCNEEYVWKSPGGVPETHVCWKPQGHAGMHECGEDIGACFVQWKAVT